MHVFLYALLSVIVVSLMSVVGVSFYMFKDKVLRKWLFLAVSFSVGALLGGVFIHILPHLAEEGEFSFKVSVALLLSIIGFFVLEKYLHWHHCGEMEDKCEGNVKSYGYMNLIGDGVHNLIDGIAIGSAYMVDVSLGVATTLAVILHEIPQEIGDFGVLLHAGFSRGKALWYNFLSALTSVLGVVGVFVFGKGIEVFLPYILAVTAGSFIYISVSDLMPEMHKERNFLRNIMQIISVLVGVGVMFLVMLINS